MRIVGGSHRGRRLAAPAGRGLRPTTDRVREALFNVLAHGPGGLDGARVLDAFAGTGALGLEALSRGAGHATFFETDRRALQCVRDNVEAIGETARATVLIADATQPPPAPARAACSLVFLDPPYGQDVVAEALAALAAGGWLASAATIVVETASGADFAPPAGCALTDARHYGATSLYFVRLDATDGAGAGERA